LKREILFWSPLLYLIKWANSSNWYLFTVQEVTSDLTFDVKVFGTVIYVEEQLLPMGLSVTVAHPIYVMLAKGTLKDMSDSLTLAWSESQSSNKKGLAVAQVKEIKNISMYGIPDLDRTPRQRSVKTEGIKYEYGVDSTYIAVITYGSSLHD
jgi:hypothetical protein